MEVFECHYCSWYHYKYNSAHNSFRWPLKLYVRMEISQHARCIFNLCQGGYMLPVSVCLFVCLIFVCRQHNTERTEPNPGEGCVMGQGTSHYIFQADLDHLPCIWIFFSTLKSGVCCVTSALVEVSTLLSTYSSILLIKWWASAAGNLGYI